MMYMKLIEEIIGLRNKIYRSRINKLIKIKMIRKKKNQKVKQIMKGSMELHQLLSIELINKTLSI